MTQSLRTRLLVGIVSGMILLLTVFSILIYTLTHRAFVNQFDASLLSTARMLAASVEQDNEEVDLESSVQEMPEFQKAEHPTYYQLWNDDSTVIARSPSLSTNDLPRFEGSHNIPVFQAFNMKPGRPGRAVGFKFKPRMADNEGMNRQPPAKARELTLGVARDADDLQDNLEFLRWLLLIASSGTITLSFLVAAFVVRQGLSPLNSLATEIAAIKENNLTARVATEPMPTEILPIKERLNDLLSRLEASFNRERRFTSDVAHELRTPLAAIRSTIEVTLTRTRDACEYRSALSECLQIAQDMQTMVNNLLSLVRLEANQVTFCKKKTRIAEMVNSCWRPFFETAHRRNVSFENRIDDIIAVQSDPEYLSMLLSNVLSNAAEYTNSGGQIWATAGHTNNAIEITISNTGCTLNSDMISHVFDPFWRGDPSRSNTNVHCGLGLALVRRIMQALGGSVSAELQPTDVFLIRIILPDTVEDS